MKQTRSGAWQGLLNILNDLRHNWEHLAYGRELTDDATAVNRTSITQALQNETHLTPGRGGFDTFYIGQDYDRDAGIAPARELNLQPDMAPAPEPDVSPER